MSTPELNLKEAIELYAKIGFEGVEIICADDYSCALQIDSSPAVIEETKVLLSYHELQVSDLVAYTKNYNLKDNQKRRDAIDELKRVIDLAYLMDCHSVRLWAGEDPQGKIENSYELLIQSFQQIGVYLKGSTITANVENHPFSEAISAERTVQIVEDVGSENIGIVYDPANLIVMGNQDYHQGFEVQKPYINHVHLKDLIYHDELPLGASVIGDKEYKHAKAEPRLFDHGQIPWREFIKFLKGYGYQKFVSLEYEKRWHPHAIPHAAVALPGELELVKQLRENS